jgi:hypothetical protein
MRGGLLLKFGHSRPQIHDAGEGSGHHLCETVTG